MNAAVKPQRVLTYNWLQARLSVWEAEAKKPPESLLQI